MDSKATFNELHGHAIKRITNDRISGVSEDGIAWMIRDWLRSLALRPDLADDQAVHEVWLVLVDDGLITGQFAHDPLHA